MCTLNFQTSKWRLFRVPFPGLPKDIWCCNQPGKKMPAQLKRLLDDDHKDSNEPSNKKFRPQTSGIHAACFDNDLDAIIDAYQGKGPKYIIGRHDSSELCMSFRVIPSWQHFSNAIFLFFQMKVWTQLVWNNLFFYFFDNGKYLFFNLVKNLFRGLTLEPKKYVFETWGSDGFDKSEDCTRKHKSKSYV